MDLIFSISAGLKRDRRRPWGESGGVERADDEPLGDEDRLSRLLDVTSPPPPTHRLRVGDSW